MSQSREKLVTDERTDERTNERTKVNLKDLQGRSKNEEEKNELFFYKAEIVRFQYKETSNLADFKYVSRIFTSALFGKLQRLKAGSKYQF